MISLQYPKRLVGYLTYNRFNVPFEFDLEEFVLYLYPNTRQKRRLIRPEDLSPYFHYDPSNHNWIKHKTVTGTSTDKRKVIFCIETLPLSFHDFPCFNVLWFFYGAQEMDTNDITSLYIENDTIDSFFNPKVALDSEVQWDELTDNISKMSISATKQISKPCGTYRIKKSNTAHINVAAYAIADLLSYSQPIYSKSRLAVTFDSPIDIHTALAISTDLQRLLVFISYRTDIRIQRVNLISFNEEKKQNLSGLLAFPKRNNPPIDGHPKKRIIEYSVLNEHTGNLIEDLNANKILLDQTPTIDTRNSITPGRTAMIFAAFERVVNSYYGKDADRSERYKDIKREFGELIDDFVNTKSGKNKDYAKSIKRQFDYLDSSFSNKVKYALSDCFETMNPLLAEKYNDCKDTTITALGYRLNELRNHLVHGNLGLEIDPIHVADIQLLEVLIYAIVLKHVGISPEASRTALGQLFNESSLL